MYQKTQTTCVACSAGSYQNTAGRTACIACGANTYQDTTGQTACTPCTLSCDTGLYLVGACTPFITSTCQPCTQACGPYGSCSPTNVCVCAPGGFGTLCKSRNALYTGNTTGADGCMGQDDVLRSTDYDSTVEVDGGTAYAYSNKLGSLWSTGNYTGNLTGPWRLCAQADSNIVMYSGANTQHPVWDLGTYHTGPLPLLLVMQNDSNLVLYTGGCGVTIHNSLS